MKKLLIAFAKYFRTKWVKFKYKNKTLIKSEYSREELELKLRWIADNPVPRLKYESIPECYDQEMPSDTEDYICINCNEKSLYDRQVIGSSVDVVRDIYQCREIVEGIKEIDLRLDESQFCRICSPNIKNPELGIIVNYKNSKGTFKKYGINIDDLILIKEFLEGKLKREIDYYTEAPMKDYSDRIKELLNIN